MDEETLRDLCFSKGRILIATEETSQIERWIRLEVQGVIYEVLIREESSSESPDVIASSTKSMERIDAEKAKEILQRMVSTEPYSKVREKEDDEVESRVEESANGKEVVGEENRWVSRQKVIELQGNGTDQNGVVGPMHINTDKQLMLTSGGRIANIWNSESVESDSGGKVDLNKDSQISFLG